MTLARSFPCAYDKGIPVAVDPRLKKKAPPTCPRSELPTPPNSAVESPINIREKRSISPGPDLILHKKAKSVLLLQSPSLISSPINFERRRPAHIKVPSRPSPPTDDEPSPPPPRDEAPTTPDTSGGPSFDRSPRPHALSSARISNGLSIPNATSGETSLALAAQLASLAPISAKIPALANRDVESARFPTPPIPSVQQEKGDVIIVGAPQHIRPIPSLSNDASALPQAPVFPLDAIDTLQQVASDLIKTLIDKGAATRERQLMQAVGTIRTCLEVEFAPHMDAWKLMQAATVVQAVKSPSGMSKEYMEKEKETRVQAVQPLPDTQEVVVDKMKAPRISIISPASALREYFNARKTRH
jgi:hypothetical protein